MSAKDSDVVSASEIAAWDWCPESWRLAALGAEPENRAELDRGKRFHSRMTAFEVWSRRAMTLGRWLLLLAILLSALWYLFWEGTAP